MLMMNSDRQSRLFRSSVLLFANSAMSGVLGLLFWVVVGANFEASVGGVIASILSLSSIVAVLSSLGFTTSLVRFMPESPSARETFAHIAISRNLLASLVLGIISLSLLWAVVAELNEVLSFSVFISCSLIVILLISNGAILDSIFVGSFRAGYALARNLLGGLLRLALIFPLLSAGIVGLLVVYSASLLVPMCLSLLVLVPLAIPGFRLRLWIDAERDMDAFTKYTRASYPADVLASISMVYFPLLVATVSGLPEAGFFFICWSIGSLVFVIPSSLTISLFAEASCPGAHLELLRRKVAVLGAASISLIILIVTIFGQTLLGFFGALVSSDSHITLVIICLSSVPMLLLKIDITELRLRSLLRQATTVNAVVMAVSLCGAVALLSIVGIPGVAVGWLLGQTAGTGTARFFLMRAGHVSH